MPLSAPKRCGNDKIAASQRIRLSPEAFGVGSQSFTTGEKKLPNLPNLPKCTLRLGRVEVGLGHERKVEKRDAWAYSAKAVALATKAGQRTLRDGSGQVLGKEKLPNVAANDSGVSSDSAPKPSKVR